MSKLISALVFSVPVVAACTQTAYACAVSSAYRYVLLDNIPSETPFGAIVLAVEPKNLEVGDFNTTRHVTELKVVEVQLGTYTEGTVRMMVSPNSSCTRGNESPKSRYLIGFVHKDKKHGAIFFPVQYIGEAHRRQGKGDLDRAIITEKRFIDRSLRALKKAGK